MRKTIIVGILTLLSGTSISTLAEVGNDVHIQSSNDAIRLEIDRRTFNEIQTFLKLGYPPVSVMLHGVTLGVTINDMVFLAVKSDVRRAQEFYDTAVALLPSLPGWAIQDESEGADRYIVVYEAGELGSRPTVAEVARRFFEENKRLGPLPEWFTGGFHVRVSIDELANLAKDAWWYQSGNLQPESLSHASNRPIFVSLYQDNNEIILDSGMQRIQDAQRRGLQDLPVVFIFNDRRYRPISRYGEDVSVKEIVDDFFNVGRRLTPVPEWKVGDHHMLASVEELSRIVEALDRDDVDPERWAAITEEIRSAGFDRPLLLSLFNSGDGRVWANEADRLAAAIEMGLDEIPVVFFYHDIGRLPCGDPIRSTALICSAAIAAGGDPAICEPPRPRVEGFVSPGGGGGFTPTPTPPEPPSR